MIKRLKSAWSSFYTWFRSSFSRRIMSALLICTSLVIVTSSVVYYYSSVHLLKNEYIHANSDLSKEINQSVQRYMEQVDAVTQSLYNDNTFMDNLIHHNDDYVSLAYNEKAIKSILYADDAIQYIYFYIPYNQTLYSFPRQNVSHCVYPDIEKQIWYQKTVSNERYFYIEPLHTFQNYTHFGSTEDELVFSANRALRYYVTGDIIGIISISYNTRYLNKICQNLTSDNSYIAVLNNEMNPLFSTWPDHTLPRNIKKVLKNQADITNNYTYSSASQKRILLWDKQSDFYILKDIPFKQLTKGTVAILQILIAFSLTIFVVSILVSFYVAKSATRNLKALTQSIAEFGNGNLQINSHDYGTDEIGILASTFHEMTNQINELIDLQYKAQILKKSAELQTLQSQIKPHYINNVLQAIGTLGLKKGSTEVYSMANALASNLRYSLKPTTQLVPLQQEIDNMNSYLYIQKILWDDRLTVTMTVDDDLTDVPVPVFILQPLVENSLKHGLDSCSEGHIQITISQQNSNLFIKVQDNGRGIPPASLKMLQEWLSEETIQIQNDEHIGIRNIYNRILLIYKGKGSFTIDSPAEGGTVIEIILPMEGIQDV